MTKRTSSRIPRAAYLAFFLLSCTLNASAYQSRSIIGVTTQHATSASRVRRKPVRSELFQSQGVEEDFRVISAEEHQTNTSSKIRWLRQTWSRALRVDRKQVAELGMSFMLTYNLVSNINGSIFLSLAWYITSIRVSAWPAYFFESLPFVPNLRIQLFLDGTFTNRCRAMERLAGNLCWALRIYNSFPTITIGAGSRVNETGGSGA